MTQKKKKPKLELPKTARLSKSAVPKFRLNPDIKALTERTVDSADSTPR